MMARTHRFSQDRDKDGRDARAVRAVRRENKRSSIRADRQATKIQTRSYK